MSDVVLVLAILIACCVGVYYLHKQGKLPWVQDMLDKLRMSDILGSWGNNAEKDIERLKALTEKELEKSRVLHELLEAKTELANARKDNDRLRQEIKQIGEQDKAKQKSYYK